MDEIDFDECVGCGEHISNCKCSENAQKMMEQWERRRKVTLHPPDTKSGKIESNDIFWYGK